MRSFKQTAVTKTLAEFASSTRFDDIPDRVVSRAKLLLADGIANVIVGGTCQPARIQERLLLELGGSAQATVLASGVRTSVTSAAYLNSAAANVLDFDDTYKTFAHPGATAISPALCVAEWRGCTGRDFLTAVVLAYEVQLRVMQAGRPSADRRREVWGFGVWQTLGAAVGAARLMGLDASRTAHAIGLGAFNAPVPNVPKLGLGREPPSWTKNSFGCAAVGGILGALFAEGGVDGNPAVLDGPGAFWMMAGSDRFDAEAAIAKIGDEYLLEETSIKPYACCRWSHSALDAVAELCTRRRLSDSYFPASPHDPIDIEVALFTEGAEALACSRPANIFEAQFSLPHLVALEMLGRSPRFGLDEALLDDPVVGAQASRVRVIADTSLDGAFQAGRMPVRVTFSSDDNVITIVRGDALGSATFPYEDAQAEDKFFALLRHVLGAERTAELAELVATIETADRVTQLVSAAVPSCEPS